MPARMPVSQGPALMMTCYQHSTCDRRDTASQQNRVSYGGADCKFQNHWANGILHTRLFFQLNFCIGKWVTTMMYEKSILASF